MKDSKKSLPESQGRNRLRDRIEQICGAIPPYDPEYSYIPRTLVRSFRNHFKKRRHQETGALLAIFTGEWVSGDFVIQLNDGNDRKYDRSIKFLRKSNFIKAGAIPGLGLLNELAVLSLLDELFPETER